MKTTLLTGVLLTTVLPTLAAAEPMALRCVYTESTYSAAFMTEPGTRACPQARCYYDLRFDSEGGSGSVNGVEGYSVEVSETQYVLQRSAQNVIMGGIDTALFIVEREGLGFRSKKTTTPSVTLETKGQCGPL